MNRAHIRNQGIPPESLSKLESLSHSVKLGSSTFGTACVLLCMLWLLCSVSCRNRDTQPTAPVTTIAGEAVTTQNGGAPQVNPEVERQSDFSIVPGERIGKVTINASRQSVHQALGRPDGQYDVSSDILGDYWTSKSGDHLRVFYKDNRAIQVSVESPRFATPEGLTTESSLDEVRTQYRNLSKNSYQANGSGGSLIEYYDAAQQGIAFEFTGPQTFDSNRSTPTNLFAIIVHQPGRPVVPDSDERPVKAE